MHAGQALEIRGSSTWLDIPFFCLCRARFVCCSSLLCFGPEEAQWLLEGKGNRAFRLNSFSMRGEYSKRPYLLFSTRKKRRGIYNRRKLSNSPKGDSITFLLRFCYYPGFFFWNSHQTWGEERRFGIWGERPGSRQKMEKRRSFLLMHHVVV